MNENLSETLPRFSLGAPRGLFTAAREGLLPAHGSTRR